MTTISDRTDAADEAAASPLVRSHRRLILGAAIVVVIAVLLTWLVAFSSVFGVRTVDVRGTHRLSPATIRQVAHIERGTPLLRLDTGAIRGRVARIPDVASASVRVSYPSTVIITVTERQAVAFLVDGSGYEIVDRTGAQFRHDTTRPPLPELRVPPGEATARRATIAAAAVVAADLPATLLARITSIQAMDPDVITVVLHDGRVVLWGSADQSTLKARELAALLKRAGEQFDLSDPGQPVVR